MRRAAFLSLIMAEEAFTKMSPADRARRAQELEPLFGHDLAQQPPVTMKQLRATARYDAFPRLALLGQVPTLVVTGRHDRIARPAYGSELAQGIPGSRLIELAEGAHGLPIQMAPQVNALLAEHFDRAGSPP
jgi:pimeloyl-ACP methyl ester carboxylesterase